jgi:hypothetical protein
MRYSLSAKSYPLRWSYYYRIICSLRLGLNPSSETISIAAAEELTYRQSRLCRLLGNPVAFSIG